MAYTHQCHRIYLYLNCLLHLLFLTQPNQTKPSSAFFCFLLHVSLLLLLFLLLLLSIHEPRAYRPHALRLRSWLSPHHHRRRPHRRITPQPHPLLFRRRLSRLHQQGPNIVSQPRPRIRLTPSEKLSCRLPLPPRRLRRRHHQP